MIVVLKEEGFRNFRIRVVLFHLQLPGTHDDESLIVPCLANRLYTKKPSSQKSSSSSAFTNKISSGNIPFHPQRKSF
jgi:hypothetical protein